MDQLIILLASIGMLALGMADIYFENKAHKKRSAVWQDCFARLKAGEDVDPAEYSCLSPRDRSYLDGIRKGLTISSKETNAQSEKAG